MALGPWLGGVYTEVQKAWQTWIFVDFGQESSVQDGRAGGAKLRACHGFQISFHGQKTSGPNCAKPHAGAVRRSDPPRRACSQYDPKVIVGARTLDLKGDAYYGS